MIRHAARLLLLLSLVSFALGCSSPSPTVAASPPREATSTPLFWHATSSDGGAFYLLGSVHIGRKDAPSLGPAVESGWTRSEELVVEVDVSGISEDEIEQLMERYGALRSGRKVWSEITPDTARKLASYVDKHGIDRSIVEPLKPWVPWMVLTQVELQESGFNVEFGVDKSFINRAVGHKPIVGLETMESQFEALDRLPPDLQSLMLQDVLTRMGQLTRDTETLIAAWRSGDEDRLEELVFRPLEEMPELEAFYERVFFRRNELMAIGLQNLGRDGRTRFVVVGAGHLVGDRSVVSHLDDLGYDIERIESVSDLPDLE